MQNVPLPIESELTPFYKAGEFFRKENRYKLPLAYCAYLLLAEMNKTVRIWPVNLSNDGIGFLHTAPLEVGMRCRMRLPKSDGDPVIVPATISHCTKTPSKEWLVGCQFGKCLSEDDVNDLLD